MRIIISPAKQMRVDTDSFACKELPVFVDRTEVLMKWIQSLSYDVFEDGQYDYVQEHLRILSGFYGVVKPMDGVVPYRLEMQAKAAVNGHKNLYDFWGDSLYREVVCDSRIVINLASKEYSKCIEKYLQPDDRYITCIFGELEGDKVVQKGVYAKMARGEMVRFMAGIHAEAPEQMKDFNWSGYRFAGDRSSNQEYVFIRTVIPGKKSLPL